MTIFAWSGNEILHNPFRIFSDPVGFAIRIKKRIVKQSPEKISSMKEYFSLLIIPPRSFADQVKKLKETLVPRLGDTYSGKNSPAHLSICSFSMKAGKSGELVACIGSIVPAVPVLQLKINVV